MKKLFALALVFVMMFTSVALAAEYTYDPAHPYDGVMTGLFEDVEIAGNEKDVGLATYYLPQGLQPWAQAVLILTPDGTTSKDFAASEIGGQWKALADEYKIGVVFLAPVDGTWNLTLDADKPDDGAVINQTYFTMRSKSVKLVAPFSMDKTHCSLIGYQEGGAAALLFGVEYVTNFSSVIAVDAPAVPAESLATVSEQIVLPFPMDNANFAEDMQVVAKTVAVPVWFLNSATENTLDYYLAVTKAVETEAGKYENPENPAVRVWVTSGAQDAKGIYDLFAGRTNHFMGMQDGGRIAFTTDMTTPNFVHYEEEINGELRRWIAYVPSSYDGSAAVPLVIAIHGYTASAPSMVEESRWWEIAEKEGFIVMFMQGFVRDLPSRGNVPCATWIAGSFEAKEGDPAVDHDIDSRFINAAMDRMLADYSIDASRIYCTGHSNGSMMTLDLSQASTARFAAIAPIAGFGSTGEYNEGILIPTWMLCGSFESMAKFSAEAGSVKEIQKANVQNGVDETKVVSSEEYDGQWHTITFTSPEGAPLTRFTVIDRTSHIYMPEEPQMIWAEFFSKYSRGEDGTLLYEGNPVTAGTYVADDAWYTK